MSKINYVIKKKNKIDQKLKNLINKNINIKNLKALLLQANALICNNITCWMNKSLYNMGSMVRFPRDKTHWVEDSSSSSIIKIILE
ncbi:hypothetical protein BpHYR1_010713 [Brachionus plicatilis]|uniref:Uncharacterized protein n=1 Tax=Brachionus plicatilis TaxID=10195 RepID=A0A3M7SKU6_BRAPC|nr:hypothetical protein BpHYR1_010713 [Brachionus plicatilis]